MLASAAICSIRRGKLEGSRYARVALIAVLASIVDTELLPVIVTFCVFYDFFLLHRVWSYWRTGAHTTGTQREGNTHSERTVQFPRRPGPQVLVQVQVRVRVQIALLDSG